MCLKSSDKTPKHALAKAGSLFALHIISICHKAAQNAAALRRLNEILKMFVRRKWLFVFFRGLLILGNGDEADTPFDKEMIE